MNKWLDDVRLAASLLTVAPVGSRVRDVRRETVGDAMALAPVVGLAVGLAGAAVLVVGGWIGLGGLLQAVLVVALFAAVTRGLHLDGLADLADGLGGGRDAESAMAIMKRSDIGPFGVITLVLTLAVQIAAITQAPRVAVIAAAVTGRLAITWACRTGVPSARTDGLGALVAGTVRPTAARVETVVVVVAAAAVGWFGYGHLHGAVVLPAAVLAGLLCAELLRRHAVRRLGGITGDVLGALTEIAVAVTLLVSCVR